MQVEHEILASEPELAQQTLEFDTQLIGPFLLEDSHQVLRVYRHRFGELESGMVFLRLLDLRGGGFVVEGVE